MLRNALTLTVPKNRKPKFDLTLHIIDINNIPLVAGTATVKWHLPTFSGAEHRGRTEKVYINDHKAIWDYGKEIPIRLTIDKAQNLQECEIVFEVVQEYFQGARDGRVTLGQIKLNLAEYTNTLEAEVQQSGDKEENDDGMITRRYLMQNSKVNATVKIGIRMKQTEGDTNFIPPPLKSAMVIGGIAGIMNAEAGDSEDMPSLTSKTRELSEAQDTYRRTLAATWACQAGELAPDKLIEDLFAGGDGGRMEPPAPRKGLGHGFRFGSNRESMDGNDSTSDTESRRTVTEGRRDSNALLSPASARSRGGHHRRIQSGDSDFNSNQQSQNQHHHINNHHHHHHHHQQHQQQQQQHHTGPTISGRGSIEQQIQHSHAHHASRRNHQNSEAQELTEFDLRDDLRSWQIQVQ